MNIGNAALGFLLGLVASAILIRFHLSKPRWVVRVSNGYESSRVSWFEARILCRNFPGAIARVVRV